MCKQSLIGFILPIGFWPWLVGRIIALPLGRVDRSLSCEVQGILGIVIGLVVHKVLQILNTTSPTNRSASS